MKSNIDTHLTIQSIISSALVRELTCSLQYTLRHAYIATRPPMKLSLPRSNTAAFPMYASEPRCRYRNGPATASSAPGPQYSPFSMSVSRCFANLLNLRPRYLPCCEAT